MKSAVPRIPSAGRSRGSGRTEAGTLLICHPPRSSRSTRAFDIAACSPPANVPCPAALIARPSDCANFASSTIFGAPVSIKKCASRPLTRTATIGSGSVWRNRMTAGPVCGATRSTVGSVRASIVARFPAMRGSLGASCASTSSQCRASVMLFAVDREPRQTERGRCVIWIGLYRRRVGALRRSKIARLESGVAVNRRGEE